MRKGFNCSKDNGSPKNDQKNRPLITQWWRLEGIHQEWW